MRRNLLNLALAVALVPAAIYLVLRRMPDSPQTTVGFPYFKHRVAVALAEVCRAELTSVVEGQLSLNQAIPTGTGSGTATMDSYRIPKDVDAFWFPVGNTPPGLWTIQGYSITGVARDGRSIQASIEDDPIGLGSVVDFHGDAEAARVFAPRMAEILAHPKFKHESPEDRAALIAFFEASGKQPTLSTVMSLPVAPPVAPPPPQAIVVPPGATFVDASGKPVDASGKPIVPQPLFDPAMFPQTGDPAVKPAATPGPEPKAAVAPPPAKEAGPPGA